MYSYKSALTLRNIFLLCVARFLPHMVRVYVERKGISVLVSSLSVLVEGSHDLIVKPLFCSGRKIVPCI